MKVSVSNTKDVKIEDTQIDGLKVIEIPVHHDLRGSFSETYNMKSLCSSGLDIHFVQDNQSYSKKMGTLRGLHFQMDPYAQDKLVRCVVGSIFDVAVDLRSDSKTFGEWFGMFLTAQNAKQLFIPRGFAHGFLTMENDCIIAYKASSSYSKSHEVTLKWDDPDIGIKWPMEIPISILSEKDQAGVSLSQVKSFR